MQVTKRQAEFYTVILVLCIIVGAAIMLVDYGIKAAILEESNRLRRAIESWENGRSAEKTATGRADNDATVDGPISPDLLVDNTPGMEAGNVPSGATESVHNSTNGRAKSRRPTRPRGISSGDK